MQRTNQPQHEGRSSRATSEYAARRVRRRRRQHAYRQQPRWAGILLQTGFTVAITLVLVAAIGVFLIDRTYSGRIIPNVSVQGVALEGRTPEDAAAALRERYAAFLARPLAIEFEGRVWQPALEEIGVSLHIGAAVDQAYGIGRGGNPIASILELITTWREGVELPIRVIVDEQRLQSYLLAIGREVERAPRNADISVLNGRVLTLTAQTGRQALIDDTMRDVLAQLDMVTPIRVVVRTRLIPPLIEDAGITTANQQLQSLLRAPVTLRAGTQQWQWDTQKLGTLVRVARVPLTAGRGYTLTATLDRTLLRQWIAPLAAEIDAASAEPRLRFTTTGLQVTEAGQNGRRFEVDAAVDQLMQALWQEPRDITLPVTVIQPQARPDTFAALGIGELVAQGQSSFEASAPYRVQNIQAGARQMDGVLIAPGEEFSFNRTVGAIDESNGFTQGYAIIDGRTQLEWGGGVCQVSTTVFRAAFWAGVPITERNQHSFRIRWYEVFEPIGMDAAIFTGPGGYDFRFVNDTGSWLLMQTRVDTANEVLTVSFYGTKPIREVVQIPAAITNEIPAPTQPRYVDDPKLPFGTLKQTDTARGGMDVTVGRLVKQNGVVVREDSFFSRFQPWPDIFVRGTGRG